MGRPEKLERNRQIEAAYLKGATMEQIADAAKLTRQRIAQIIQKAALAGRVPSWLGQMRKAEYARARLQANLLEYGRKSGAARRSKNWPPEKVARLVELAGLNWSGSEIGRDLGISRSAVLGYCFRNRIRLNGGAPDAMERRSESRSETAKRTWRDPVIRAKRLKRKSSKPYDIKPEVRAARSARMKAMWAAVRQAGTPE